MVSETIRIQREITQTVQAKKENNYPNLLEFKHIHGSLNIKC